MPTISSFYGIIIMMFFAKREHNPPHIHAYYNEYEASFKIEDGEIFAGDFPRNGKRLVKEFILHYQDELIKMWQTGEFKKLPAIN
jgi:hypothetical protein